MIGLYRPVGAFLACLALCCGIYFAVLDYDGASANQGTDAKERPRPRMLWDNVTSNANLEVRRTKVPEGWFVLVRDRTQSSNREKSIGGAFYYPDPEYAWDGKSQPR